MKITTVGLDLAKSVFQVHGVDVRGKAVLRKQLQRSEMATFFANLPSCLIGMEACSSAHHWARKLVALGHEVRLMAPQFVKPYRRHESRPAYASSVPQNFGVIPVEVASRSMRPSLPPLISHAI